MSYTIRSRQSGEIITLPRIMVNGCDSGRDIYGNMDIRGAFPEVEALENGDEIMVGDDDDIIWWITYGDGYNETESDIDELADEIGEDESAFQLLEREYKIFGRHTSIRALVSDIVSKSIGPCDYEDERRFSIDVIQDIRNTLQGAQS